MSNLTMDKLVALCKSRGFIYPGSEIYGGLASEIYSDLAKYFMVEYDETGSIGKRYRRQDEIGTPYCITVDFDTETDGSVTVRDRDTMQQERVKVEDLKAFIESKLRF